MLALPVIGFGNWKHGTRPVDRSTECVVRKAIPQQKGKTEMEEATERQDIELNMTHGCA